MREENEQEKASRLIKAIDACLEKRAKSISFHGEDVYVVLRALLLLSRAFDLLIVPLMTMREQNPFGKKK